MSLFFRTPGCVTALRLAMVAAAGHSLGCSAEAEFGTAGDGESESLGTVEEAHFYCGGTYEELKVNTLSAVGFLNNGCTAFMIDEEHIVAAGHCFAGGGGSWAKDLRFYPNFHPSRVTANAAAVPHAEVDRMVVGSRAPIGNGWGNDWGIGHLTNWKFRNNILITPVKLASAVPAVGTNLTNPAYTRHHLPYNDNDAVTWDNMEWDSGCGMWAVKSKPAPLFDGVNADAKSCNVRWSAGFIHKNCEIQSVQNEVVFHSCATTGGSSGSPVLWNNAGTWEAIAVTHGSAGQQFNSQNSGPSCETYDPDVTTGNKSPSVDRFRHAPRYASNIAINRSPTNAAATAVFAIDSDLDTVVYRTRKGSAPNYFSEFNYWNSLSKPKVLPADYKLTRIAACNQTNSKPQVFVVLDDKAIYSRVADADGTWGSWTPFGVPSGVTSVSDLDAAYDSSGRCQLFMVSSGGNAYVRPMTGATTWGSWSTVATGTFNRVTSLNADGVTWAALLDTNGDIWRTSRTTSAWSAPVKLARPSGITWTDMDMTWDEAGRAFMLAIPTAQNNRLHFVPMYGSTAWQWRYFDTTLWAPNETNPVNAPRLRSITASRWMEDPSGTVSPVVMGTDDKGNVYLVEYQRRKSPHGWDLRWKSFYHEYIPD